MKRNSLIAFIVVVMTGLLPFLISCDNGTDPAGDTISGSVGIVFPNDYLRWDIDKARFEADLSAAGVQYIVLNSENSLVTEAQNVATLIESGIKVLILCPVSSADATDAVEAAHEAGITVIAYDRLITQTSAVDYYVTFSSEEVGQMQGQYLVDHATGTGNPLYLYAGSETDNNSFLFFRELGHYFNPKSRTVPS
jgi:putative multiple sugar transport system substrate-binding protein